MSSIVKNINKSKKKIFSTIKKKRQHVNILNNELEFLNDVYFDTSIHYIMNMKLNELTLYRNVNLPDIYVDINEKYYSKEDILNMLNNNVIKIKLLNNKV